MGFLAVDRLVDEWKAEGPVQKFGGEVFQAQYGREKIVLVKPQTFMNLSGRCVGPLVTFYKCEPEDIVVIHDDIDLEAFALRIKTGGGTGGHNGLKSIDENLGGGRNGYHRVRIGIGREAGAAVGGPAGENPGENASGNGMKKRKSAADHVLEQFSDDELGTLDRLLDDVVKAVELILDGNVNGAMNSFNRRRDERAKG